MKKKRLIWLVWLAITFCLYFFENNTGTRIVLAISAILPFVSAFFAILCTERLYFEISAPGSVRKCMDFDCRLKVSGPFFLSCCTPVCRICVGNPLTGEAYESDRIQADRVRSLCLNSIHCGNLVIRLTDAAVEDLFGLFRFPVAGARTNEMRTTVYPTLFPVRIIRSDVSGSSGESGRREYSAANGKDPSVYDGVREYVPGDPVRQIHWKLSVKTDRILVREQEKEESNNIGLYFVTVMSHPDADAIDTATEALLSVSYALISENIAHCIYRYECSQKGFESIDVFSDSDFLQMRDELLCTELVIDEKLMLSEKDLPSGKVISFGPSEENRFSIYDDAVVEI